jgi:hypothetical protein
MVTKADETVLEAQQVRSSGTTAGKATGATNRQ